MMLNKNSSVPLHTQISDYLLEKISTKQYKLGERLPSERELCELFGVSRITVRKAIGELIAQHKVHSVAGMGSFVAFPTMNDMVRPLSSFTEDMAQRGMNAFSKILDAVTQKADADLAARMKINKGDEIIFLKRLRLVNPDNIPVAIQNSFISLKHCPNLLSFDLQKRSLFEIIRNEYGLRLSQGETTISARLANPEEGKLLQFPLPSAVLVTDQVTYIENNEVIEAAHSVFRSDLYHLTVVA